MVGFVANTPDEVVWAGLGKMMLARCNQRSWHIRVLREFGHVCLENDVVAVSFPALLVEAGDGSFKSFSYGSIGGSAAAELGSGVSEECGRLRVRNLFGAVVPETVAVDVAQVPLRED